ncbi:hypothetical protein PROFUN_13872 [Planoprotostelium fungivorum]|uniref:Haloacid dehalogenase-like hydrolase domain-containing protein 3 n=1 Tax=Planoprotostelium fungivorum TaxID=1890364 RepID=A0A2P6N2V2_9EUKA|nr:hypothetical protein PROFUN_13872 [Planoprotostelium fungivorum]
MSGKAVRALTFDGMGTLFEIRGGVGRFYAREARRHGVALRTEMSHKPERMFFKNPYDGTSTKQNIEAPDELRDSFYRAYKQADAKWPNFGSENNVESKQWWKEVVYNTYRGADYLTSKEEEETLSKMSDSLYSQFSSVEGYKLFPETKAVLADVRERVDSIGLITNTDERIHQVLESLGIHHLFDFVLCSREFGKRKPDPSIYTEACRLSKHHPSQVMHVGDHYEKDFLGAKGIGMEALLVTRGQDMEEEREDLRGLIIPDLMPLHSTFGKRLDMTEGDVFS